MKMLKLIRTEEEYDQAIERLGFLMDIEAEPNTPEGDELDILAVLIEKYEEENYEIPTLDPIEVIEFFMEQHGLERKDMIGIIGDKTLVSRILNRKRKLTLDMIRNLMNKLPIPLKLLINDYELGS
nr:transcriptional regulator [uncultured Draconibacterium sp.]